MVKILLLENPHTIAGKTLHDANIEMQCTDGSLDENVLIEAPQGCQTVGTRSEINLSRRVFEPCLDLVRAGASTIGISQINSEAVAAHGVAMFNVPYSNTHSIAELTISEIIALMRLLPVRNAHMQRTGWQKTAQNSHEVYRKTLGIIGYSFTNIQPSVLAEAVRVRVQFYGLAKELLVDNARQCDSLEEASQGTDFVSLHVDGRPANRNVFGAREIIMMKPGSKLSNLSREFVVGVDALAATLDSGHLRSCAVDVFPEEPLKNGGPLESPLLGKENMILTPCTGSSTLEAREDTGSFVSAKTCNYIQTRETVVSVNMPTPSLQSAERARYRVSVIHQNTLGAIGHINQVMAATNVSVEDQILGMNGEVGYAIADIASELSVAAVQDINTMDTTTRCWVIPLPGFTRVDAATVN